MLDIGLGLWHTFAVSSEPTIEQMKTDLLCGGWTPVHPWLWESPSGLLFRGPHLAWHKWAGTPMCDPNAQEKK